MPKHSDDNWRLLTGAVSGLLTLLLGLVAWLWNDHMQEHRLLQQRVRDLEAKVGQTRQDVALGMAEIEDNTEALRTLFDLYRGDVAPRRPE